MNFKKLLGDTRIQVSLTLFLVLILAVWHERTINSFLDPLAAVFIVGALDLLITKVRFGKSYLPASSLVSGLLVGLIIAPSEKFWIVILAAAAATLSKQFIGAGMRRHIFNPAAFGIISVNLIFGTPVSWWGVAWSPWPLVILMPVMFLILKKLMRLWIPTGFLATYFVYLLTIMAPTDAVNTIADGSVMLFALVMLPEPITSPNRGYLKYIFGPMVAVLAILTGKILPLSENFLLALLAGNLIGFLVFGGAKTFLKPAGAQGN